MQPREPSQLNVAKPVDLESICVRVRAEFGAPRVHAVSLHDEAGEVLWMTEGSMGPDEHDVVRAAFDAFAAPANPALFVRSLDESRSAVLFGAMDKGRVLVGAVMVIADSRGIQANADGLARLMSGNLRRALTDFAGMRAGSVKSPPVAPAIAGKGQSQRATQAGKSESVATAPPATTGEELALSLLEGEGSPPRPDRGGPAATKATVLTPTARAGEGAELSLADSMRIPRPASPIPDAEPTAPKGPASAKSPRSPKNPKNPKSLPEVDRIQAAMRRSPIALYIQRLVPLAKGSPLRRYEVLLRSASPDAPNAAPQEMLKAAVECGLGSMVDRRVVTQLVGWLARHPQAWSDEPIMLSVNLTATALVDENFVPFVARCLAKASLSPATIAFEIDATSLEGRYDRVAALAGALAGLGCPLVLDNFRLRPECFDMLGLPGLKYVKLAADIVAFARSRTVAQAAICGVAQMARVVGVHTVIKHIDSAADRQWCAALGVDFMQSNAVSPAVSIEKLLER